MYECRATPSTSIFPALGSQPQSLSALTTYYRAHGHSMKLAVTKRQCRIPTPPVELVKNLNMGRPGKVLKSFRIVGGVQ